MPCSTKTRVKVIKPGELDDVRRPVKENSESASERKAETRVIKVRSGSAAVSSVDGAYCGPD